MSDGSTLRVRADTPETSVLRVAVELDLVQCIRVARDVHHLPPSVIAGDEGVVLSLTLASAFGGHVLLRPWAIARRNNERITVVGSGDADALRAALDGCSPLGQAVVHDIRALPPIEVAMGQRIRFETRVCPTVHRTRGSEIDAYLAAIDGDGAAPPRESVYAKWLTERLRGVNVHDVQMSAFSLAPVFRPTHGSGRRWVPRTYPDVTLRGVATVVDPAVFASTLRAGVGRQRAYGRGWVWTEVVA